MKQTKKLIYSFILFSFLTLGFYKTGFISCKSGISFDLTHLKNKKNIIPVLIIGSGPAGLTSAIYSSRLGYPTYLVRGGMPGGQLTQTTYIENWPGEKKILGPELMEHQEKQAQDLGATFIQGKVEFVDLSRWPFEVKTSEDQTFNALSIIVSTGATPRTLGIPGEKEYWGKGVTTCAVCDAPFYKGKNVVVIGGGDSATEQALQLSPHVKHVEVLVRRDQMRASKAMQDNIAKLDNVSVSFNKAPKEIIGDGSHVTGIKVFDSKENKEISIPIDGVFLAIGHEPNTKIFKGQLEMNSGGYLELKGRSQKTSVKGVFAAGDVEDHVYRQAIIAAGSGSKAALDADFFLQSIGVNAEVLKSIKSEVYEPEVDSEVVISEVHLKHQLEELTKKNNLVIADFYGTQCPPCKMMMPVFESLSKKFANKVAFVKVDTAKAEELVHELKIIKIPCFVVYKNGQVVDKRYGVIDKKEMESWINSFI